MTYDEIMAKVREIEPILREHAPRAEAEARLPKEAFKALKDQGLFAIWVPKALGGWEVDPVTAARVFEELTTIDSAAAWHVQMCNTIAGFGRWFNDEAVAEMYDGGNMVFGDSFHPPMAARPVDGGFRVTGQCPFSSACHHHDWYFFLANEVEGDQPRLVDGHPVTHLMAIPTKETTIVENWDTLGMRGSGSDDVRIDDGFVPTRRAPLLEPIDQANNQAFRNTFDKMSFWYLLGPFAAISLGVGRAALDHFIGLTKAKIPSYTETMLNAMPLTHYRLGEAKARLEAARSHLYGTLQTQWERAQRGEQITPEQKCDMELAAIFAQQSAAAAIDLIAASAGTSVVRNASELCRHFRDAHTITQHAYISTNRYEDCGAMLLGQEPKWPFMAF